MFSLAILIGIYSYLIFSLGLLRFLYPGIILLISLCYLALIFYFRREELMNFFKCFKTFKKYYRRKITDKFTLIILAIISAQIIVNLIGALGPEISFDALWYHLTLPKIYLATHRISFIPGGLLYYSAMPRLAEMLYTAVLAIQGEILAKVIHWGFGILSLVALYKLSKKFFSSRISLFTVLIFYSNLIVGWQSITAYVDLTRTFFETMALWGFLNWFKTKERKWLIESALMIGLAISTKLLALGSLFIFLILILLYGLYEKKSFKDLLICLFAYLLIALLIPLPWLVFSFINTGNPIYPLFTNIYKIGFDLSLINPLRFLIETWNLFLYSADPISPIYVIFLPLVVLFFKRFKPEIKLIAFYSFLAIVVWYLTPRTGGGRFILPYLGAFSVVIGGTMEAIKNLKGIKIIGLSLIIFISLLSLVYRGVANSKYLPVVLAKETKAQFLTNHLNFSFGDFYDIDGYFKNRIKPGERVLLYGFHNLYYVDFPFIDSSWVKKGDTFNYIAVQNTELPKRFWYWELIYQNSKTGIKLYSLGGQQWVY